jgi:hypothetical protein
MVSVHALRRCRSASALCSANSRIIAKSYTALRQAHQHLRISCAAMTATSWYSGLPEDAEAFTKRFGGEKLPATRR